jgi:hypothetical protein
MNASAFISVVAGLGLFIIGTSLFERIIWLLRRYSTLLTPRTEPAPAPAMAYGAESRVTAAS